MEQTLRRLTQQLLEQGAMGIALTGSHARGEAHDHSDIDLVVVGTGTSTFRLETDHLVSAAWATPDEIRASWLDPAEAGMAVPGWRHAIPLADPDDVVAQLQREAERWRWEDLGDAPDRWIGGEIAGYAEEVQRLVGHLEAGRRWPAAVMRNLLANRMAVLAAVHLRLLYATENRLWDLVGDQLGEPWRSDQAAAFGEDGEDLATSCRAALRLYHHTATLVDPLLTSDERAVVRAVLALLAT